MHIYSEGNSYYWASFTIQSSTTFLALKHKFKVLNTHSIFLPHVTEKAHYSHKYHSTEATPHCGHKQKKTQTPRDVVRDVGGEWIS